MSPGKRANLLGYGAALAVIVVAFLAVTWDGARAVYDAVRASDWVRVTARAVAADRYRYTIGGEVYEGHGIAVMPRNFATGDRIDESEQALRDAFAGNLPLMAYVNPAHPSQAFLDRDLTAGMMTAQLAALGVLTLFALKLRRMLRAELARPEAAAGLGPRPRRPVLAAVVWILAAIWGLLTLIALFGWASGGAHLADAWIPLFLFVLCAGCGAWGYYLLGDEPAGPVAEAAPGSTQ